MSYLCAPPKWYDVDPRIMNPQSIVVLNDPAGEDQNDSNGVAQHHQQLLQQQQTPPSQQSSVSGLSVDPQHWEGEAVGFLAFLDEKEQSKKKTSSKSPRYRMPSSNKDNTRAVIFRFIERAVKKWWMSVQNSKIDIYRYIFLYREITHTQLQRV